MKLCYYYLLLLLFLCQTATAQRQQLEQTIDSLLLADRHFPTEDKARLERYEKLYKCYAKLNQEAQVVAYTGKAMRLADKLKLPRSAGDAWYHLGYYYHSRGKYIPAEEAYKTGIKKATEIGYRQLYGDIYYNLGAMYASWPDYDKALHANLEAVAVFNELGDKESAAGCQVNIASAYKGLAQYQQAIAYLHKALEVFKNTKGNEYGIALSCSELASIYFQADEQKLGMSKTQKMQAALQYLALAEGPANQVQVYDLLGDINVTRGRIYSMNGDVEAAEHAFRKALEYNKGMTDISLYANSLLSFSEFLMSQQRYADAAPLVSEALKIGEEGKWPQVQRDAQLALSTLAEKQQQYTVALDHYKAYIRYRDQLFNEQNEREITRKRMQLDFLIKENDYKHQQHTMSLALQKRTLEATQRKQALELKERESRIQKLAFLQRQATLEREKLQKENELERQRLNANLDRKSRDEKILIQENKTKLNRNLAIFLGVILLGLSGAALLIYRANRKTAQLNRVISSQKAELEELGKVKDRILGMVSHDMRAPVNSLISFTRLLEHGNLSEDKLKAYTLSLTTTLGHASNMMDNVLNWAYSQMQGFKPELQMLDISTVVKELVDAAASDAARKKLQLNYTQDGAATAFGDVNMVALIVRNLLNNAIKFTPEGGQIAISIVQATSCLQLRISDTGVGLSAAQQEWFNSDSVAVSRSTRGTNSEKGFGLGLTLCKTFAAMMHANISAARNVQGGTTFELSMPYSQV
ncbi:tetratricopeptide repeat-containing sensor histidine kinase [Chitinophaga sp. sic0106]|uniref:tetratricopeptide repeat-containing sensor histidine kinase n=1 Tax=Chitinophaga sp. sic0106 TaxID=2854785 RepID=UPI001C44B239|nr:tetratricopeptide repeat-containing sensor histidine kinase [Chitinophaga sp. sic0106]MBV7532466.1 tetratricopeptide repeat protein [Chitinophaga sp. sic0106]